MEPERLTDTQREELAARDASDIRAPWAGYQWKVRELIDRAQAAEADYERVLSELDRLRDGIKAVDRWERTVVGEVNDFTSLRRIIDPLLDAR